MATCKTLSSWLRKRYGSSAPANFRKLSIQERLKVRAAFKRECHAEMSNGSEPRIFVTYQGERISLRELSKKLNIDYDTLRYRHQRGQDLTAPLQKEILVIHEGERISLMNLARKLNIEYSTLYSRYQKGLPLDSPLQYGSQPEIYVTHQGERISLKDLSKKLNINYKTLYYRYQKGEDLTAPVQEDIFVTHKGERISLQNLAKKLNIDYSTLYQRHRNGEDLTAPVSHVHNERFITFRGETRSVTEWAHRLNLTTTGLEWRLENWPLDRALTDSRNPGKGPIPEKITFGGETHSLTQWAKKIGISDSALYARLYINNWPIEKALTTPHIDKGEQDG